MSKYIDWNDVTQRYERVGDLGGAAEISSTYIIYAEAEVEGKLASGFSVPFSNNNLTVRDLCIDTVLAKIWAYKDPKKAKFIKDSVDDTVKKLLNGSMTMITTSGDAMFADVGVAWSETQDYPPTFGAGDIEDFIVSSSRLYNEEIARD